MIKVTVRAVPEQYRAKLEEHAQIERAREQQRRAQQAPRDDAGRFRPVARPKAPRS